MKYKFLIIISVITIVFYSCNKDEEECESVIENSGIIESSVDFQCDTPFYDGNFVIDSQSELDSVTNLNTGCNQPEINFSQYTVLGNYTYTEGKGSYYRNVEIDTANLTYDYTITVKTCGECNCLSQNIDGVLVRRITAGLYGGFYIELA